MWAVFESKKAQKQLKKVPKNILKEYEAWKTVIELSGPKAIREIPGYHDHALKGELTGARSSYLNKQWRVIYIKNGQKIEIYVLEVNPHEYKK